MISLKDIFDNKISHTKQYTTKISEIIKHLTVGGWPFLLGLDVNVGKQLLNGYINGICEIDISQVDGVKKDPHMVRRLLRSLARNIATPVTNRTLINEMGDDASVSPNTYAKYYDALERIHIVEDLSA
jgi:predicted AAA+ superfamily ATPase